MRLHMKPEPFYVGSFVGVAEFLASIPHGVRNYIALLCFAVVVDMISGIGAAIVRGHLKSSKLWDGFYRKVLQYSAALAIGVIVVVLFESWVLLNIVSGAILAREVGSILENIILAQPAGQSLGKLGEAIEFLRGVFSVGLEEKNMRIVSTTAVISPDPSQDVITTTNIREPIGSHKQAERNVKS